MRAARLLVLAALLALTMTTAAQARTHGLAYGPGDVAVGVDGKPLPLRIASKAALARKIARTANRGTGLAVGTDRIWPALDDAQGFVYLKNYTLRGVGQNIEVWVANDSDEVSTGTEFLPGDCRNGRVHDHGRAGRLPDRRVRHEDLPARIANAERAPVPRRRRG